jgi:hypothetical protein
MQLPYNNRLMSGRKILKRVAIGVVAAIALVYLGDTLSVWHRMSHRTASDPLMTMTTQPVIEIPHKDGEAEIVLGAAVEVTCVRALFPHDGCNPCWYVERENQAPIVMTLLPLLEIAGGMGRSVGYSPTFSSHSARQTLAAKF